MTRRTIARGVTDDPGNVLFGPSVSAGEAHTYLVIRRTTREHDRMIPLNAHGGRLRRESPVARATANLNPIQRREIALAALVDEKTLARCLNGGVVRPSPRERIRRALESRGITHLLPSETTR